jgi:hypothetical protein
MTSFYTSVYMVGVPNDSEFFGNEISPKFLILKEENNRVSMQVSYIDNEVKPIGHIKTVVAASPDEPYLLIDSTITFYPEFFRNCPSLEKIRKSLGDTTFLDLDLNMPKGWRELREEALPYFRKLRINSAIFEENWRVDR